MFKVKFSGSVIFEHQTVEACIAFALEIHRLSNVPHTVMVLDKEDCEVVSLEFEKK